MSNWSKGEASGSAVWNMWSNCYPWRLMFCSNILQRMCKTTKPWVGFCDEGDLFRSFQQSRERKVYFPPNQEEQLQGAGRPPQSARVLWSYKSAPWQWRRVSLLNETSCPDSKKHIELLSPNEKPSDYYPIKQNICDRQMGGMSSNS